MVLDYQASRCINRSRVPPQHVPERLVSIVNRKLNVFGKPKVLPVLLGIDAGLFFEHFRYY